MLPILLTAVGHRPDEHGRAARSDPRHDHRGHVRDRRGGGLGAAGRGCRRSTSRPRRCGARCSRRSRLALGLAALLLCSAADPGTSGVKVNLFGVQPVEAIRLLVVFALAAYFARRLELLRELSEPATPVRPVAAFVRLPRWKDVRPVVVSMALVLAFFFLQKDLGPALVLSCVVHGALRHRARPRRRSSFAGFAMLARRLRRRVLDRHPATVGQRVAIWLNPVEQRRAGRQSDRARAVGAVDRRLWGSGPGPREPAIDSGRPYRLRARRDRRGARVRRASRWSSRSTRF